MEALQIVTPPETLPITVEELKTHLRITHDDEDEYIEALANVAYNWIEDEADITISETEYRLILPGFSENIVLPKPPLISLDSIAYFDADDEEQTLASGEYHLITPYRLPAYIKVKEPPQTYFRPDAVTVEFTAGYSELPYQIPHLIRLLVGHLYEHREAEITLQSKTLELGVDRLLAQVRNYRYV